MPHHFINYKRLESHTQKRILCLGDSMLDTFLYGVVERLSPEAPVPVFQETSQETMLGGASNVAANLNAYGVGVDFVSVVGSDDEAVTQSDLFKDLTHVSTRLLMEEGRLTTLKKRYIAGGCHLLRADREEFRALSRTSHDMIVSMLPALLAQTNIVLLSDYNKGFFTPELTQQLIAMARAQGKFIIVDPKGADFSKYNGATLITPNKMELKIATGLPVASDEEIVLAAQHLIAAHDIETVLVTRSSDGMSLITATNHFHLKTEVKHVFDVSGAGDTTVATLAMALACDIDLKIACEIANVAAGIVVGKVGTAVVSRQELLSALKVKFPEYIPEKLVSRGQALEMVAHWRQRGQKIGFTNGCFDLIHPGHVNLIRNAKRQCDVLIIGLNSDTSVKCLKGAQRPMQSELDRAAILASLAHTDLVVIFDELTPFDLIKEIEPDVLIKGSDYTIDQVVGADVVGAYGGNVVLVDLVPNCSTTGIISRMAS